MKIFLVVFTLIAIGSQVNGHGMLWDPPSRSSMWRFYPDSPKNYDDTAVFCGGASVQWQQNDGKCGACGDNVADKTPRDNENGGTYGQGRIPRFYRENTNIQVQVNITASHLGHFEFNICELTHSDPETDECFARHPLFLLDGSLKYEVTPDIDHAQVHVVYLRLPQGLTCDHCVMRWHYRAGNSYGICDDGTSALGCGAQETFRNCADISIVP